MAKILDGKKLREKLSNSLQVKIEKLEKSPKLIIIQIGDSKESDLYIKEKKDYGERVGVTVEHRKYPVDVSEELLLSEIDEFNFDDTVDGIIVQLPVPVHLNKNRIIDKINPEKDVDGLTSENISFLVQNKEKVLPATSKGIITLLENYGIEIKSKKAVVVGGSFLVGRPTALALLNRGATVTVCHADTKGLEKETRQADILITATGKSGLITSAHVSPEQVVVDVGINFKQEGGVRGDVNYREVQDLVGAITPVPGGVGPMTVFSLFDNLFVVTE